VTTCKESLPDKPPLASCTQYESEPSKSHTPSCSHSYFLHLFLPVLLGGSEACRLILHDLANVLVRAKNHLDPKSHLWFELDEYWAELTSKSAFLLPLEVLKARDSKS
jgi:hypothetical protein